MKKTEDVKELMKNYILNLGLKLKLPNGFNKDLIVENINPQRSANNPIIVSPELINEVLKDIMLY